MRCDSFIVKGISNAGRKKGTGTCPLDRPSIKEPGDAIGSTTGSSADLCVQPFGSRDNQVGRIHHELQQAHVGSEMFMTTFTAAIKIRGINPFILVSAVRANAIKPGWRKPLPVLVRINGKPESAWRINMMPVGDGSFYLYLRGDVRNASDTKVGDRVRVEIDFDASYQNGPQHPMPQWFKQGLLGNPQAMKNWKALAPSRKKEILRYISGLKSPDARARNLSKALHVLSGETGRFMARTWENGS